MSLEAGFDALKQGRYQEAVPLLRQYCHCSDARAKDYLRGLMGLAKAYQGSGQTQKAIALGFFLPSLF